MRLTILDRFESDAFDQKKQLAVLIDPDKSENIDEVVRTANSQGIGYFFIGGSLLHEGSTGTTLSHIREKSEIPTVIFPGATFHLHPAADAVLFLSLVSGRNPDLLIGRQVEAAPLIKRYGIEAIPTAYILVDGGRPTSASYMSHTIPVPANKPEIAACTALAAKMLGMKVIYLDAGSGALNPVSVKMISAVKSETGLPLIVGGGIRTPEAASLAWEAGADIVVVGNAIEEDIAIMSGLAKSYAEIK